MKVIFQTRLILWKKHWPSMLFWLLFPLIITCVLITQFTSIQADTKVPVGIVLEEETLLAEDLYTSLQDTPHIRPIILSEREALNQLEKHELDSVFIIRNQYEANIQKGSRNQLIKSYQSDLSFAYTPLRETVVSYVQQDYSRSKTAYIVQNIGTEYEVLDEWSWDELIERSKEIEQEQKLLDVDFTFAQTDEQVDTENKSILHSWGIWALLSLLATFMLFDWVIKENHSTITARFAFGKVSFKKYVLQNALLYTGLLFLFDLCTIVFFHLLLDERMSISIIVSLLFYRIMMNSCIFIFTMLFRSVYLYYTSSFAIVLLVALISGVLVPTEGINTKFSVIQFLNPLAAFLSEGYINIWLIIGIALIVWWYVRKEEIDA